MTDNALMSSPSVLAMSCDVTLFSTCAANKVFIPSPTTWAVSCNVPIFSTCIAYGSGFYSPIPVQTFNLQLRTPLFFFHVCNRCHAPSPAHIFSVYHLKLLNCQGRCRNAATHTSPAHLST